MTGTNHRALALVMLGVSIALSVLAILPCAAQDESPALAPENPAFLEFLRDPYVLLQQEAESGLVTGIVPDPVDFSYLKDIVGGSGLLTVTALPSSYDLRALGRVTPIRNQGGCGSCWSFATYSSLESNLMPAESLNLSENNLKNLHGFDLSCCSGGNRAMSTAYLARWAGAISETQDPYNASSCASPSGLLPVKHVQEVIYIPTRSGYLDNDALKQAVMTYGGVYTAYYHNDAYYNSATGGYYYNGSSQSNHGVCIVGWDDNFDKSKFRTPPPGNGAFIIRNSWGNWGLQGYFYMSYYDTRLASENGAFIGEPANNYDGIYQYDTLGWTSSTGYGSNTAWFANVFTATSSSKIAAASFYTGAPNSTYEVRVYTNPTSGPISTSGPAATTTGTIAMVGYHTVKMPTPVSITSGQKFSVVVKLTTPGYGYPIALERPYSGFASKATASTGQSYMSSTGTSWTDVAAQYANTNVCLKAFTSGASGPAPGALSVTPATGLTASGPAGGPFSPSSQVYTLTNTGGASIDWTAAKTKSWVGLSPTSGTLAAGASTTVTASIASDAGTLAVGSYSDTVTFTNTTSGQSTARSVALTVQGAGSLAVSPSTTLSSSGTVGGPFSPSSQQYTLTNTGGQSIDWAASVNQAWITLSLTGGTLAPGASATATISINSNASALAAGTYTGSVSFVNETNGSGNATRGVELTVTQPAPVSNYQVGPTAYIWIDPSSHAAVTLSDNSAVGRTLPFAFRFYGQDYNSIYVGSNGLMGFGYSGVTSYGNRSIPYSYTPNAMICPYWDNLNPSASGASVRMGVVGAAPNRKVVVSWVNVPSNYSSTARFTFQAVLCEGSNDMVFQYQNTAMSNYSYGRGRSATVGIENQSGTQGCMYSYNTAALSDGQALIITYNGLGPVPGALSVTPSGALNSSGLEGGPFSPSSMVYTLTNTGGEAIGWTAGATEPWVTLSATGGSLAAGASTTVSVSINSGANSLTPGSYSDTVSFSNATNGNGDTTRGVSLTVNGPAPPGALSVTPATGLSAAGAVGGPFNPSSQIFTVSNTGGQPLNWTVSTTQPWLTRSATGGTLAAGASTTVSVSLNSAANSLAAGSYADTVSFANTSGGSGSTTRPVSLSVSDPAPSAGYRAMQTNFNWIDPTSHTTITLSNNSVAAPRTMPFLFDFYGTSYNSLRIGANGLIGFAGTTGLYSGYNLNLPTTSGPNGAIYAYWDQLNLTGGQVKMGVIGSAPNRKVVVSWVNVGHYYSSTTRFTFQAILCEGTNDIITQYLTSGSANYAYGGGRSATIGIENATGTEACKFSYNSRSIFDGMAVGFTRNSAVQSPVRTVRQTR